MLAKRRDAIHRRWQEIETKLEQVWLTGESPLPTVDAEFYQGQLLEELDELEYELVVDYLERRPQEAR